MVINYDDIIPFDDAITEASFKITSPVEIELDVIGWCMQGYFVKGSPCKSISYTYLSKILTVELNENGIGLITFPKSPTSS